MLEDLLYAGASLSISERLADCFGLEVHGREPLLGPSAGGLGGREE